MNPIFKCAFCLSVIFIFAANAYSQDYGWYTEGNMAPNLRVKISLANTLDFDRKDCPVMITRYQMPIKDLHEMRIAVVDPSLPPIMEPSKEDLKKYGPQILQKETNGHSIFCQLDDLDKDGLWDELFFQTDIKAHETKTIYLYIGFNERGWNPHGTHAAIGSYSHHVVPFWESEYMGWKLWYPTDVDLYGKRQPALTSYELYSENLDGYMVPPEHGSDIMTVENTFGAGGICLFEEPSKPDSVSRPRFTPVMSEQMTEHNFNLGQITDTRYAYEVVVNGPLRSMVRCKTFNWKAGAGIYELEQVYTSYNKQNYATCDVKYTKFLPKNQETMFGCGIRKNGHEKVYYQDGGTVITMGDAPIENPDDKQGIKSVTVDFIGTALIVKDMYKPKYQFVKSFGGNHTFKIPTTGNISYGYMILAAWSEGSVLNTTDKFKDYVIKTAKEYNNPLEIKELKIEKK
jgi:hypothetical protein